MLGRGGRAVSGVDSAINGALATDEKFKPEISDLLLGLTDQTCTRMIGTRFAFQHWVLSL
jgi:hypothetical protein